MASDTHAKSARQGEWLEHTAVGRLIVSTEPHARLFGGLSGVSGSFSLVVWAVLVEWASIAVNGGTSLAPSISSSTGCSVIVDFVPVACPGDKSTSRRICF